MGVIEEGGSMSNEGAKYTRIKRYLAGELGRQSWIIGEPDDSRASRADT